VLVAFACQSQQSAPRFNSPALRRWRHQSSHSAAARCIIAWWARHSYYVLALGGLEGVPPWPIFFYAGVGEGRLSFAHARAEAHFAGSFLRYSGQTPRLAT
jgi:hypothetical protein